MLNTKKQKQLTIEELRKLNGFENINDEEAQHVIVTLEKLSILFFDLFQKNKSKEI